MIQLLLLATAYAADADAAAVPELKCTEGTFVSTDSDLKKFEKCQALGLDCYPQLVAGTTEADGVCVKIATPAQCTDALSYGSPYNSATDTIKALVRSGAMLGLKCKQDTAGAPQDGECTEVAVENGVNSADYDSPCNLIKGCMGGVANATTCIDYKEADLNTSLVGKTDLKAATISKICEVQNDTGFLGFYEDAEVYSFQCTSGTKFASCEEIKDPALCTEAGLFSTEIQREGEDDKTTPTGDTCIRKEDIDPESTDAAETEVCKAVACDEITYKDVSKPSTGAKGVANVAGFGTDNIQTFCSTMGCEVDAKDATKCSSASRLVAGLITGLFVAAFL